jgi:DNA-binding CsgD family transcriptional regulator
MGMSSRLSHTGPSADEPVTFTCDRNEVGRIKLGRRAFRVVSLSDAPPRPDPGELCRFRLAGAELAVIEEPRRHRTTEKPPSDDLTQRLTGRELEIAVLVAQGHANKNIAWRLRISEWTVATYMRRIFCKLNVDNRAEMVFRCASLITASLEPALTRRAGRDRS